MSVSKPNFTSNLPKELQNTKLIQLEQQAQRIGGSLTFSQGYLELNAPEYLAFQFPTAYFCPDSKEGCRELGSSIYEISKFVRATWQPKFDKFSGIANYVGYYLVFKEYQIDLVTNNKSARREKVYYYHEIGPHKTFPGLHNLALDLALKVIQNLANLLPTAI